MGDGRRRLVLILMFVLPAALNGPKVEVEVGLGVRGSEVPKLPVRLP